MDKQHLQNQKHLQKFPDCFSQILQSGSIPPGISVHSNPIVPIAFSIFCYSFGIFVNRMSCSCNTPLEALVIVIFHVDNRFLSAIFLGRKECGPAKRDKICKMNIKQKYIYLAKPKSGAPKFLFNSLYRRPRLVNNVLILFLFLLLASVSKAAPYSLQ